MRTPVCKCGQVARASKRQKSNGTWHWGYYCWDCTEFVLYKGKKIQLHDGADLDVMDVIEYAETRTCEWCKQEKFCENHHYWPEEFFPGDADKGPTGWLCVECHDLWHMQVTGRELRRAVGDI